MNDQSDNTNTPVQRPGYDESSAAGSALPFVLAIPLIVAMTYAGWKWWQVQQSEAVRSQAVLADFSLPPISDFELTERSGDPFRNADMRGRVWVATYFFTTCPGNCIRLNRNIQLMHNLPELKDVTWVSITCDPDTDTVEALSDYATHWQADPGRWLFCRGDLEYTQQIAKGMKLFLGRKGHQDYAVVFDKAGKIRGMYNATSKSECQRLRAKLAELLEEEPPRELAVVEDAERKSPRVN